MNINEIVAAVVAKLRRNNSASAETVNFVLDQLGQIEGDQTEYDVHDLQARTERQNDRDDDLASLAAQLQERAYDLTKREDELHNKQIAFDEKIAAFELQFAKTAVNEVNAPAADSTNV